VRGLVRARLKKPQSGSPIRHPRTEKVGGSGAYQDDGRDSGQSVPELTPYRLSGQQMPHRELRGFGAS